MGAFTSVNDTIANVLSPITRYITIVSRTVIVYSTAFLGGNWSRPFSRTVQHLLGAYLHLQGDSGSPYFTDEHEVAGVDAFAYDLPETTEFNCINNGSGATSVAWYVDDCKLSVMKNAVR